MSTSSSHATETPFEGGTEPLTFVTCHFLCDALSGISVSGERELFELAYCM